MFVNAINSFICTYECEIAVIIITPVYLSDSISVAAMLMISVVIAATNRTILTIGWFIW